MKKMPIVEVEWIDSCGTSGWADTEFYMNKTSVSKCRSVGYLLKRDRHEITLIQSQDIGNDKMNDAISIPRVAIKAMRVFKEPK